jgi:hypothetical protein
MARLLKQRSSNTTDRLPTKENKLPFSISVCTVCSKQTEVYLFVFHLQQTNGSCHVLLVPFPFTVTQSLHVTKRKHRDTCDYLLVQYRRVDYKVCYI